MSPLFVVLKNKLPEKTEGDVRKQMLDQYSKTKDVAFLLVAQQIINVFDDEELANHCARALTRDYPHDRFSVAQLHMVVSSVDWS